MSSSYIARPASVMREGKAVFDSMQDCLCGYDNAILHILEFRIRQLTYVSLRLRVQNAVSAQPCVGKFRISLILLNFLHGNFRLWFETP